MNLVRKSYRLMGRMLALALLVAQFGAEVHLYSHPLADPADLLGAARSCGTCLASSQLQHAVGAPPPPVPARSIAWTAVVPEFSAPVFYQAPFPAFRSRAPPALV